VTGLPDGVTVEIEFTASVWTDVTTYASAESKVSVRAGRTTEFDDVGPSTCTLVLRNDDGRFTPDSAGSPYYPDVIEGRRIRVTVTESAVDYPLFTGSILSWEPNYSSGMLDTGTVTVTANDALALLALHTFDDRWTEETRALARTAATWVDVYVLKGDASTAAWNNIGLSTGADLGTATLVPLASPVGELAYSAPASLTLESAVEFKSVQSQGYVADIVPAAAPAVVSFWLQVPIDALYGSARVITLRDGGGEYGSIRMRNNAGSPGPSRLHRHRHPRIHPGRRGGGRGVAAGHPDASGSNTVVTVTGIDGTVASYTAAMDLTAVTHIAVGGEAVDGMASNCPDFFAAPAVIAGDATRGPCLYGGPAGADVHPHSPVLLVPEYVPRSRTWATTGGEVRTVGEPTWAGQTALACCRPSPGPSTASPTSTAPGTSPWPLRTSSGPACLRRPWTSRRTWTRRRRCRPAPGRRLPPDAGHDRLRGRHHHPRRHGAEANNQPRREVKLDTCASDVTGATFAGSYLLQATNGLRITQVAVDLTTSVANLWATFLGLYPTQRVTISGFDAALIGEATKVVFVQGWQVTIDHESLVYTLDCSPASQFVSATWDGGDEYGRWAWADGVATGTGGTAMGITGTGTLQITFTGGYGLTLDAGQYPLYLSWDGEAVRIDAPPGGSTSPQTVTIAARGQLNTAAQVHVSGESVTVWHEAVFGF
jgi:hypothetical protein